MAVPNTLKKSRNEELKIYPMDLTISGYWQHFGEWFKRTSGVIKEEKINAHYFQNCGQGQKGEQRVGGRRKKSRISS